MGAPDLLGIADELYGLDLPEFTPARDERAKALKKVEPELSARVKALRKPSTAAWVVNLLVRHEAAQVEQVLSVGAALREAQANLAGAELRALTRQRRQLTAAVTSQARSVAVEHGLKVTASVSDQVEATLTAAMVDDGCARAVRSGLLVTALATTGVEPAELADAVAVPEAFGFSATVRERGAAPRPELHVVPDPEAGRKAAAAAREKVAAAEGGLAAAIEAQAAAAARVEALEARSMQGQAEIEELKGRLVELEGQYEKVDDEIGDAEDARAESESAVAEATRARDAAAAALAALN